MLILAASSIVLLYTHTDPTVLPPFICQKVFTYEYPAVSFHPFMRMFLTPTHLQLMLTFLLDDRSNAWVGLPAA